MLHLGDPRQMNRYTYASCNPINLVHPSRTSHCTPRQTIGAVASTVADAAVLVGTIGLAIAMPPSSVVVGAFVGTVIVGSAIGLAGDGIQAADCLHALE